MPDFSAQIQVDGVWTDVPVLAKDGVSISGGRQKNASVADPTECTLTLRNDDGDLSSRNPRSPYIGYLGRGTPMRATVPDDTHLWITASGDIASTPDHATLDITGDLDIRIDVQPLTWEDELGVALGGKYATTGNQRSWAWWVFDRVPVLRWSPDGTFASAITLGATQAVVPAGDGRIAIRATLDVNNGLGGYTLTWYTAPTIAGPWTQLGDPRVGGATTSIFASTASLKVGYSEVAMDDSTGRYHALQVRSGIGGTIVANPDFTAQAAGATSFVDSAGRTWTLSGAELRDFDVRASGEVADWPVRWVTSGRKKWAPVEFAGWLRRLNQPAAPLRSPMYREATKASQTSLMVAYYPGEDGSDATQLASGIGGPPMTFSGTGSPSLAASARFPGSENVLTLATGVTLVATVPTHTGTGVIAYRMLADPPATGWTADAAICQVLAVGGTVRWWRLEVSNVGSLRVRGLDVFGDEVCNGGYIGFDIFTRRQMIGWQVTQTGSDVYWQIFSRRIADDLTVEEVGFDGTFTSQTVGRSAELRIAPAGNLDGGGIGHIMLGTSASLANGIDTAIVGNDGETAGRRLLRLGDELNIPIRIIGHPDDTEPMGPQQPGKAIDLLKACAQADRGLLGEARDEMVLEYRTRTSLYNSAPRATLAYGDDGESPHLEPDEPTEDVVNEYTAERRGGSSYKAVEETGRLSVLEFPNGVGPRPGGDTLDLETDLQLFAAAWWETHLGTWDEYRHPVVAVNLSRLVDSGKTSLARAVAAAAPGDQLVIMDPPDWLPPDPINLQVQGWTEEIRPGRRKITFNTLPGRPWLVGVAGVDLADSDGTTLVDALTAVTPGTSQAIDVDVAGTPWATDAEVPFVMWILTATGAQAERITVTAISGATSPQEFTVTRGLDGYTLAHDAGASLVLYQPLRWAR